MQEKPSRIKIFRISELSSNISSKQISVLIEYNTAEKEFIMQSAHKSIRSKGFTVC